MVFLYLSSKGHLIRKAWLILGHLNRHSQGVHVCKQFSRSGRAIVENVFRNMNGVRLAKCLRAKKTHWQAWRTALWTCSPGVREELKIILRSFTEWTRSRGACVRLGEIKALHTILHTLEQGHPAAVFYYRVVIRTQLEWCALNLVHFNYYQDYTIDEVNNLRIWISFTPHVKNLYDNHAKLWISGNRY